MSTERDDQVPQDNLVEHEEVAVSDGGAAKFAAVDIKSGEEKYNILVKLKAKLWRFDEGENQWKERGQGEAKILEHKEKNTKHVFLLRRDGTGKLGAQHDILPPMKLKPNVGSEKSWVWSTTADFSDDDEGQPETFAIRFATKEMADEFKRYWDAVTEPSK